MGVRTYEEGDHPAVVALWEAAGRDVVPRPELRATLRHTPDLMLVEEQDGALRGAVLGTFDGRRGWIWRLAVDPQQRRRGVATALVRELEARFSALGVARINLLVVPTDPGALAFWERAGYPQMPDVLCSKALARPGALPD